MNKDQKIIELLNEMHQTDASFDVNDPVLKTLVQDFIDAKPQHEVDPSFKNRLRNELINVSPFTPTRSPFVFISRISAKISEKVVSAGTGALIALIIAVPLTYALTSKMLIGTLKIPQVVKDISSGLSLKQQINDKGTNAFGKLALLPSPEATTTSETVSSEPVTPQKITSISKKGTVSQKSVVTTQTAPIFVYKGKPVSLTSGTGIVFKRDTSLGAGQQLAAFVQNLNFGLANFSSLSRLNLENLVLTEDSDKGYSVHVDFTTGTVSIISKEFESSKNNSSVAATMPTDSKLIESANNFLASHSIETTSYTKPFVEPGPTSNSVTVIYPLSLHGLDVYDEAGNRFGLEVAVDSNSNVLEVLNLTSQIYESSNYALETDIHHIISPLENASTSKAKAAEVSLDTPHNVLMRHVEHAADGSLHELYIPALLFPQAKDVTALPVVIPLLKDSLDKAGTPTIYDATERQIDISTSTKSRP
jgi:hypothetical protein